MKTAPEVDRDELASVLREEYDLDLLEWSFWPHGWESYGFIAADGHQRVFAKLLDPSLSSHQSGVRQCEQALPHLLAVEHVAVEAQRAVEVGDADPQVREPLDIHDPTLPRRLEAKRPDGARGSTSDRPPNDA